MIISIPPTISLTAVIYNTNSIAKSDVLMAIMLLKIFISAFENVPKLFQMYLILISRNKLFK